MFFGASTISTLENLLTLLDQFNQLAPGHAADDKEDLAWPGIFGQY